MNSDLIFYLIKEESPYNEMIDFMFSDIKVRDFTEKKHSFLFKIFLKNKVQDMLGWIINPIISRMFGLYKFMNNQDNKKQKYYIFLNSSFIETRIPVYCMKYYKKKWLDGKFVLLYIDIIADPVSKHANKLREHNVFDAVYNVDNNDAIKYGLKFIRPPYSANSRVGSKKIKIDMYFCGATKDRGKLILNIIKEAKKHFVKCEMDIHCNLNELQDFSNREGVNILENFVSYGRLLNNTAQASCILDLVQSGQSALTLRPYEAIVYNRKLLTNNKSILDFEFYNPQYMQYFEKPEDIDWEWIKKKENVDYGYNGEFSPKHFMRRIINDTK